MTTVSYILLEHYVRTLPTEKQKRYAIAFYRYINGFTRVIPKLDGLGRLSAKHIREEIRKW